jgi:hypothetical protein
MRKRKKKSQLVGLVVRATEKTFATPGTRELRK